MFVNDPVMKKLYSLIVIQSDILLSHTDIPSHRYFPELCKIIIGQQLSISSARSIKNKVGGLLGYDITPEIIISAENEKLRNAGLSQAKVNYIKNLAYGWLDGTVIHNHFSELSDEEIIQNLVQIKGIGRWTAEMFLIFTLGRSDVFSVGDYGLKKAITKNYKLGSNKNDETFIKLSNKWAPNRSLACKLLWKSLDLGIHCE